jgi:hypothetical protein
MRGSARNIDYEVMSEAENRPRVAHVVVPYYPPELLLRRSAAKSYSTYRSPSLEKSAASG